MKKLLLFSTLAFNLIDVSAQITVTNATFPSVGDTLWYKTDDNSPALNIGTAGGGNQIWDFSAVQGAAVAYSVWAGGNNFPAANLSAEAGDNRTIYYRKTNTVLEQLGTTGADALNLGLNTTIRYQPPLPERRAPMNFFDVNAPESDLVYVIPTGALADSLLGQLGGLVDSFRIRIHTRRLDVVDGWGTCRIPGAEFPVLREKRTTMTETFIDIHSILGWSGLNGLLGGGGSGLLENVGKDTTITYHFFSNTEKEAIAIVSMDNQGAEVRSIRYKYIPVTSATSGFENKIPVLRISPNPACNDITIHTEHLPAGNYHISIYDFQGKLVLQTAAQLSTGAPVVLNIDAVPSGTAVLHVIDAAGQSVLSEKMIKY